MSRRDDVERDRLELGDRVTESFYDDMGLRASRHIAESLDVPWYVLMPRSWFEAFGVRYRPNTEHPGATP